ncbi:HAMP domain-containing sensor histidine kinase [Microlunatus capsulatus]|uniref:histidine kinase n=1 Tax=Microlunatus capsulatus TaxID=99117 RepID=A0ABS4ZDN4_9ACTN|nr:HAMP domain-containing sensor histidine kinase [Microlunatus capsulatus]MBP2419141.1 signal transduction histidine kinase [Microlunatus capsulatus]
MSSAGTEERPASRGPETGRSIATTSLRLRVVAGVLVVLTVVLVILSFSVRTVFAAQSDRSLDALLTGRAQLARQLARSGVRPQQIVNRVTADGVLVSLELRDGTLLGSPVPTSTGVRTVSTRLAGPGRADGAQLSLGVGTSLRSEGLDDLSRILLASGLLALGLGTALAVVAVRLALHPLEVMASLAQTIAAGSRGDRLRPRRTTTEIGRTALAFDDMLDELEGAEANAREAEDRVRRFLADAAHELRTPLTGLQAAAETLLQHRDTMTDEDLDRLEMLLVGEARRAGRLVDDLLAIARLDAGTPDRREPVELSRLVADEAARAQLLAPALTITISGVGTTVLGDPAALQGLLRNLFDNARRAVEGTGSIAVTTLTTTTSVVVDVTDDGHGIPAAARESIFDRLVRLDHARAADTGGSGLGLAIARATARTHGGDLICLEPRPGGTGAHFRLTLPLPAG